MMSMRRNRGLAEHAGQRWLRAPRDRGTVYGRGTHPYMLWEVHVVESPRACLVLDLQKSLIQPKCPHQVLRPDRPVAR